MKSTIFTAIVATAFLAFPGTLSAQDMTACDVLAFDICNMCSTEACQEECEDCEKLGDMTTECQDTPACDWIRDSVKETTEEECAEVSAMLDGVLEEVQAMDPESQKIFTEEFCKTLGEE